MANLNVNRSVTDAFYRYKMPRLIAKVEGKGNGIKTVIANMSEIAKALSRPPTYPTKYFGCELGAQTQFDNKNDRYIVNGAHTSDKLQDLLDGFIRKFVLCPECDNPETNLLVKKNSILQRCIACGHTCSIDMRHKLTTFIVKNPPEPDSVTSSNGGSTTPTAPAPGKKGKKSRGKDAAGDSGNGDAGTGENNESVSRAHVATGDEEIDWGEDTSDAAVKARQEAELSGATKNIVISDDLEKSAQERVDMFYSFVKQRKVAGEVNGTEREKEVVLEAERLEIRDKAPLVLAELLYDVNILAQIKQHRNLFCRLTQANEKEQRYLLGAFEQLVGAVHPTELMPKVPHILKAFYDNDILDESVIIEWDEKPSRKYTSKMVTKEMSKEIHAKAAPFIQWLKEAEEESSEAEDGEATDEEVEVVYTDDGKAKSTAASVPARDPASAADGDESEEEDVDIDAI